METYQRFPLPLLVTEITTEGQESGEGYPQLPLLSPASPGLYFYKSPYKRAPEPVRRHQFFLLRTKLISGPGLDDFRTASLDALDAVEAPCDLIFDREVRLAPLPLRAPAAVAPIPSIPTIETTHAGNSSRSSRTRGPPRVPAPRERLLYIRNTATDPPEVAKLACHVCARSDFSSLQGLLNHCRLRHQIEYGSHDECMQSCAVLVPEEQRDWVVACGIEVGGVSLPSLRRLFELAVGAGDEVVIPARKVSPVAPVLPKTALHEVAPAPEAGHPDHAAQETLPRASAHVTKTLGYHADTPALAPFLGRAPKKRRINIRANQDEPVEIEDVHNASRLNGKQAWRQAYSHRNIAREELDEVVPLNELPNSLVAAEKLPQEDGEQSEHLGSKGTSALQQLSGTRFHINARVNVADHSLFLQPNSRPTECPNHTHRWRLTVTSPSYSLPIASLLRKLTVKCATDPPPASLLEPLIISGPPFVVMGTTDRPFIARLTFTWTGTMNPPTEIEHWVELDPMHYANPVLGDEQVFDVELDRSTELLPVSADVKEPSIEDMCDPKTTSGDADADESKEAEVEPAYSVKLRSLLPQFPMTLKDVKGRFSSRLPYTLANTRAQLQAMNYGHRKAVEMGRARALRDAYAQLIEEDHDPGAVALTAVDVFRWLEEGGFFMRATPTGTLSEAQKSAKSSRRQRGARPGTLEGNTYCRTCGLHRAFHPDVGADEDTKPAQVHVDIKPAALGAALERGLCTNFEGESATPTQRPIFDVGALIKYTPDDTASPVPYGLSRTIFVAPSPSQGKALGPNPPASPADLVAVADPKLVVAIQRLTGLPQPLNRPADELAAPNGDISYTPFAQLTRAETAAQLSPSAVLAVVLRPLVRHLVGRGVDALRQDEAALRVATGRHERARRATTATSGVARRVLAPAHVLRGVRAAGARAGTTGAALRVCLARLGEPSASQDSGSAPGATAPEEGEFHIARGAVATAGEALGLSKVSGVRAGGDAEGEMDGAIMSGPGEVLPGSVVVKAEEEEVG
ncbi:hypothetical protein C2E23DRAFT_886352 [Lenzites betulinus]|nr:hypothetical protein C2E23DRAFT_886352 [Lenzites betulinus]